MGDPDDAPPSARARSRRLIALLVGLAVAALAAVVVVRVIGTIEWASVGSALAHLTWWQPIVLVVVLLLRQFLNALPLAFYISGVGPFRAAVNDQVGIMTASVTPPPGDMAIRVALFRAWGVAVPPAIAGTTLNTLTFYIVRFGAPLIGFVLLLLANRDPGLRWLDLISVAAAAAILAGLLLVIRTDRTARALGERSGRLARRFRRGVDPVVWADGCSRFRRDASARFAWGFPRSLLATVGMLIADLTLLLLCLRFVGLDSSEISVVDVAIAYFFAYPFTVLFFSGLGIVDALIIAALVQQSGPEVEAAAVAGLIVWRVFFIGGPIVLGAICLLFLRATIRSAESVSATPASGQT